MLSDEKVNLVIEGISTLQDRLLLIVQNAAKDSDFATARERLSRWKERAVRFLEEHVSPGEADHLRNQHLDSTGIGDHLWNLSREASLYDGLLRALTEEIQDDPSVLSPPESAAFNDISPAGVRTVEIEHATEAQSAIEQCVFIGHCRNPIWARLQIFLENDLGLRTVTYESESRVGDSIVPILEKMLSQATFAILILTAADETAMGEKRARQNVIHEAGLFQGRLGFKRAVLLRQEGTEEFSNVAGLQDISFNSDQIEQTFYELQRVLKREGVIQ
jgi:hypothetical protein